MTRQFYTPAAGRSPAANIIDRADYKLDFNLKEFRQNQYVLTIEKFIPEHGWIAQQYFLSPEELVRVQSALDASK